jgi:hypothetical protein
MVAAMSAFFNSRLRRATYLNLTQGAQGVA